MKKLIKKLRTGNYKNNSIAVLTMLLFSFSIQSCQLINRLPRIKIERASDVQQNNNNKVDSALSSIKSSSVIRDTSDTKKELIKATKAIWERRLNYKTFTTKAKMQYEGDGKSFDFVANIRIQKDSVIWVNVTALNGLVQVARAIITPDSFKAVVYIQKEVYQGPISKANDFLPEGIDFFSLQNMLLGDPVFNKATITDAKDIPAFWSFRFEQDNYIQQLSYNKTDSNLNSAQILTQGQDNKAMNIIFSNYESINQQVFSDTRKINIVNGEHRLMIDMNFVNTTFDDLLSFPFSIPRNYTLK
jgi:hypothetical protein